MTRRRVFILATITLAFFVSVGLLVSADLYFQHKYPQGLNRWGYQGPVLGPKVAGERRVIMPGGSTIHGWRLEHERDTIPAQLETLLRTQISGPVRVINVAYNSEGAFASKVNLNDYLYLEPDVVVYYDGYNDIWPYLNPFVFRHQWVIFRLTGYVPILPVVLYEHLLLWRYGSLEAGYRARRPDAVVLRPDPDDEVQRLSNVLGVPPPHDERLERAIAISPEALRCGDRWKLFCQLVVNNVDFALEHGLRVIVASQPYFVPPDYERLHQEQQDRMATMVTAKYRHRPGVRYVDLRTKIDMSDRQLSFDRMHLTGRGNAIVAHALAEPVADLLRD